MARLTKAQIMREAVREVLVPYHRVSTREQAESGAGLGAQDTGIRAWAAYKNKILLEPCVDPGRSGKDMKREGLDKALTLIRSGQAGGIVVSKLDRLSRSLLDFAQLMAMALKEDFNVVALDLDIDLRTPSGELMANTLANFAQFERRVIGQRTRDGLAEKKALGVILGRPRTITPSTVELILANYETERSFVEVAAIMNALQIPTAQGGKKWWPSTVRYVVLSAREGVAA